MPIHIANALIRNNFFLFSFFLFLIEIIFSRMNGNECIDGELRCPGTGCSNRQRWIDFPLCSRRPFAQSIGCKSANHASGCCGGPERDKAIQLAQAHEPLQQKRERMSWSN